MAPNPLLDDIEQVPVVLAIAADLDKIALMDGNADRPPITGGASIYPFCWSILLAARARGLGGVMTTFLSRAEAGAAPILGLPQRPRSCGHDLPRLSRRQITKLTRQPTATFATIDRFDGEAFR